MFVRKLVKALSRAVNKEETEKIEDKGKKGNKMPSGGGQESIEEKKMKNEDSPQKLRDKGKIFVGGLDYSLTSENLQNHFSQFGEVLDAVIMRNPASGKSRGYGFVTFASPKYANSALQVFPHVLNGKQVDLRPFVSGGRVKGPKNDHAFKVFLGGLPPDMSRESLKDFFERYGEVVDIIIPLSKDTSNPKGFGFVMFKSGDAVEKCIAESCVHLGGRKVQIKRAEPRGRSQTPRVEVALECREEVESVPDLEGMGALSLTDDETFSAGSGNTSEDSRSQKTFQEYFWENSKEMSETKSEGEGKRFTELEKFLTNFLLNSGNENNTANVRSIASEDSEIEETSSGTGEDLNDSDSDSRGGTDDEVDDECEADLSNELKKKFKEIVKSSLLFNDAKDSVLKLKTSGGEKGLQVSNFRDSKGSLFCSMCEWSPHDNSFESFLAHCKTVAHKAKLRERFVKRDFQTEKPAEGSKKVEDIIKQVKQAVPATAVTKVPPPQKQQQELKAKTNVKEPKAKAVKKETVECQKAPKKPTVENKKETPDSVNIEKMKNLKAAALAKGMSCILPVSGDTLKCEMCNKKIPKSADFSILIKNVSSHLQSKKHLGKVLETESLLLQESEKKMKTKNQKNNSKKNAIAQVKASSEVQKVPKHKNVIENVSGPKPKPVLQGTAVKQKAVAKSNEKTSKLFLCVPCNFFNPQIQIFETHLRSQNHLDCFTSKGVSTDLSLDNLIFCENCETYLYGPLFWMNKHYTKCLKKKV